MTRRFFVDLGIVVGDRTEIILFNGSGEDVRARLGFWGHKTHFCLTLRSAAEYLPPMARISRVVVPDLHHVTQCGVRSLPIFSHDDHRSAHLKLMAGQVRFCAEV